MTRVTWLGHSTVAIETAGSNLLTDPVLRDRIGPIRRRSGPTGLDVGSPDAVLISHAHHDHLDVTSLRRLSHRTTVVLPTGVGQALPPQVFTDVRELDSDDETRIGNVAVRAVPARHSGRRLPFGPAAAALGYIIDGEHRLYFAGDTDVFPQMAELAGDIDLAILPVGGWGPTLRGGHMDPVRACLALAILRPRYAIAVHWGTLWPIGLDAVRRARFEEPARRFAEVAQEVAPGVTVAILDPGGRLDLRGDGTLEVWPTGRAG
jgi:L-ascorbate metabolism protein UlaG (beta-lactamase superfamily)